MLPFLGTALYPLILLNKLKLLQNFISQFLCVTLLRHSSLFVTLMKLWCSFTSRWMRTVVIQKTSTSLFPVSPSCFNSKCLPDWSDWDWSALSICRSAFAIFVQGMYFNVMLEVPVLLADSTSAASHSPDAMLRCLLPSCSWEAQLQPDH